MNCLLYLVTMTGLVMAAGSGLISASPNVFNEFNVYTSRVGGTGIGGVSVAVDGPSRSDIRYADKHDGNVTVSYMPKKGGDYRVHVRYDGIEVRGSPFRVHVRDDTPRNYYVGKLGGIDSCGQLSVGSSRVRVSGRGIVNGITNVNNEITVDARDAAPGRLSWTVEGPGYVTTKNKTMESGIYRLYYNPSDSGDYRIRIRYAERDVVGSPFSVRVL